MRSPERPLLESDQRRCPACRSQRVVRMGRTLAIAGLVKAKHWCEACGTAFWFVGKPLA
jgi:uncharacterized protein with PIN domain